MNYKKFGILFIIIFIFSILFISFTTIIIDPYFHYHKPLKNLNYTLNNQRYQNYGIIKHFNYDAIITGTSMTENFKTSEFDKLFNVSSIKVSFQGSSFKETNELLKKALENNKDIKYIIRSLDYSSFYIDKDDYIYDIETFPFYLYNDDLGDDVKYILNKKVFLKSLITLNNKKNTTFDEYNYWNDNYVFGKEVLDSNYERPEKVDDQKINKSDVKMLNDNINQNVISLIKKYPNTEFYFFYPPYSIYQWDYWNQTSQLNKYLIGEKIITKELLKYDNVHIFSFLDNYDIVTNLDNYKDTTHYSADINSFILKSMNKGEHQLTKKNYKEYYDKILKYYNNYDYDKLFK